MPVELAGPDDLPAIRALFRATLILGRPLPFDAAPLLGAYERLCLDGYLQPGGGTVVGVLRDRPGGPISGYALVCLDDRGLARRRRRDLARFAAAAAPVLLPGRSRSARRFVWGRCRDAWRLRRPPAMVRGLPHAHLNAAAARPGLPGRQLANFVDAVCAAAGRPRWYGEINARVGRRVAALAVRWGADVVQRAPNHTLSRLLGEPVERLTVLHAVPDAPAASRPAA